MLLIQDLEFCTFGDWDLGADLICDFSDKRTRYANYLDLACCGFTNHYNTYIILNDEGCPEEYFHVLESTRKGRLFNKDEWEKFQENL